MRLTLQRLMDLMWLNLSTEALALYLSAYAWAEERKVREVGTSTMANLPWAPKGKALGRALLELTAAGVIERDGSSYLVPEQLSPAAERMRRLRRNRGGTDSEHVREREHEQSANAVEVCSEPSPGTSPIHPEATSGISAVSLPDSALLSSGSGPDRKRARAARWRRVPSDWQPNEGHFSLARELGVNLESQLVLFRDHEFKDPKSDADAAFRTWLRRAGEYRTPGQVRPGAQTGSLPLLMDRIQRMEAGDEGN